MCWLRIPDHNYSDKISVHVHLLLIFNAPVEKYNTERLASGQMLVSLPGKNVFALADFLLLPVDWLIRP